MASTQFILPYTGTLTINHEYTVTLAPGTALLIDWFPDNDLIVETVHHKYFCNTDNSELLPDGRYLIRLEVVENLSDVPIKLEREPYLVANNIVIDQQKREYFTADQIDILPNELVAAHHDKVTRVLFAGDKTAVEHYIKK